MNLNSRGRVLNYFTPHTKYCPKAIQYELLFNSWIAINTIWNALPKSNSERLCEWNKKKRKAQSSCFSACFYMLLLALWCWCPSSVYGDHYRLHKGRWKGNTQKITQRRRDSAQPSDHSFIYMPFFFLWASTKHEDRGWSTGTHTHTGIHTHWGTACIRK